MNFNPHTFDLPVAEVIDELKQKLTAENTLIVNAPPGAGKSTLLPLTLLNETWLGNKKIVMLEPRRLAAKTIAWRMSDMLNEKVGTTVGYRIRFENCVSKQTRIEIVTEGILTRMLHSDNALEDVALVIFDEFHERSIYADVALALCREAQQILRPDLRIMIMSATLNTPMLSELLQASVVVSKGRQYPVEIKYCNPGDEMFLPEITAKQVMTAVKENEGDTLVFLPGEAEIRKCEAILNNNLSGFAVHPLYGQLPKGKQYSAIMPDKQGKRKIVLATSIAETSLTIEGIKTVVDTGFGRTSQFDPGSGLSKLVTVQISKDSADQRAGRAGRLSEGACYRMWSKATHERMPNHRAAEILEADLASLVLDMADWGVNDISRLTWLTPPPKRNSDEAYDTLQQLEALEEQTITAHGKKMHALPCHPRIAHMLVKAQENGTLGLATDLAAIIEERDPLSKEAGIDINLRIEALRNQRDTNRVSRSMKYIEKIARQYRKMFSIEADNTTFDPYDTGILLVYAYPERIACARPGNNAQFQMANGKYAAAGHKDDLAHEAWLAIANVQARGNSGKIFLASPLNPTDLQSMVKEKEVVEWDSRNGEVNASSILGIGSIVLRKTALPDPDREQITEAITRAIRKDGERLLNFNNDTEQWQNRVSSVKAWRPDDAWPDVSKDALIRTNAEWLSPYLTNVKNAGDLGKLNLTEILQHTLSYDKQLALDKFAPLRLEVPSGSKLKIEYRENGKPPVLSVRIQEMFGLAETPHVNQGKIPLLIHLLSPGYKPVQVTSDLKNFWNETYYEVRKELKGRYPKHHWPDNPESAEAVRGVKRKKKE